MSAEEAARGGFITQQLQVVSLDGSYVLDALAGVPLVDEVDGELLDIHEPKTAAEHRFEDAELRLAAGTQGERAQEQLGVQVSRERADHVGQAVGDVDLV